MANAETISSAELAIEVTTAIGSPNLILYGDDQDSAPVWADSAGDRPSDFSPLTSASTSYTDGTTGSKTVDCTAIIQEIVNRGGWSSGNDLRMAFRDNSGGGLNYITFDSFETPGGSPAQLTIVTPASGADFLWIS